jgi:tetratricopeptide (TPR) repeat protein
MYLEGITGDTSMALPKIRKALEINPNNKVAYNVWAYMSKIDYNSRIKLLKKGISIDSNWAVNYTDLGYFLYFDGGNVNEAIACFKKAHQLDSTKPGPIKSWAKLL